MDELALIQGAKSGDLDAFNRLVLNYQGLAFNVALRIMGDEPSAADATQEAFISAYRGLKRYRGGSFRAWLLRIVTNACYDELRRLKRRPAASLDEMMEQEAALPVASPTEGPEAAVQRSELIRVIEDCLQGLAPEFRVVAVLVDIQGFNYQEVAESIGKPLGTVKSRLARARAKLRECLQEHGELLPTSIRLQNEAAR
ncbi:MAG: sigma-70 family RNA polymerase sigma factor [Chloroflexi bacterium]|nr:sigma-70 family RNA polymerase sigma factor [Chloroflexota bacterium]MDK1045956.1 sigma-70 family RNA polymerase sigma factor [Anaerolineales bacterium]MCI0773746.1 sigma-70 family RNA polymerase sigma factor [Chloroflexota bacterium]MCI0807270.1 sigma-70 family RNA polymerase sigma factor [Chloroflexota bacterium]MCI0827933.1 sigma-70 family RNA polymerase sigma factor [Chloroflexota bacterium]